MIELQNVTLTFPDGDGRVTAVDDVTHRDALDGLVTVVDGRVV